MIFRCAALLGPTTNAATKFAPLTTPILYQFLYSPYNEKVRWALELKGIAHERCSLLPGPHMRLVSKISGQTQTPVLVVGGRAIAGSAGILDELDRLYPEPLLTPPAARDAHSAYDIERRFDEIFVPRMRRALLARMMDHPDYLVQVFGGDHSALARVAYRAALPFARGLMRRGNGITGPASIEDGERAISEALDFVKDSLARRPFLVGPRLSRADIAAACAIGALTSPEGTPMQKPQPMPAALSAWIAPYADHPAADWAAALLRKRAVHVRIEATSKP